MTVVVRGIREEDDRPRHLEIFACFLPRTGGLHPITTSALHGASVSFAIKKAGSGSDAGSINIAPLGAQVLPFKWTEHRMVAVTRPAPAVIEPVADYASGEATLARQSEKKLEGALAQNATRSAENLSERTTNGGVKVGDFVVVRYADNNRVRRIFLSDTENRPEDGIVHFSQPLGRAVLGADIDDEIQFPHRDKTRSAIIERIERASC
jgi:transcription elongation GreA/GreB family factor